ncbi:MAG: acetate--CoA ligase family protein [Hyphomicrobiaceae bacterium]|nr:acetate--CoA ligase family protein [Hyphomicrobiaceae bacterium]
MQATGPGDQARDIETDRAAVRAMLSPESIAIIGAGPDTNKLSGRPLHFLRRDGFAGRIYPVNPKYSDIAGVPCFPDIASLPEAPDMAIVAVGAARVGATVAALGQKGCKVAVIFSSGFGELGEAGKRMEADLLAIGRENNIRICGPNTLGLVNAFVRSTATFSQYADQPPVPGRIGFASQSGAFGTAIAALARVKGLGLGYFVSTGNTIDITPMECLAEIIEDERIQVAAGYVEGIADGDQLVRLAHRARELAKPLVITKVGRHAAGARAAQSHTGSLAGEDRVFDAVVRQAGAIRARNEEHMLDMVAALVANPVAQGRGLGIITQSGGAGVLMADRAEELGLEVPLLSAATRERLKAVLPEFGASGNPVDVTGQFLAEPRILSESVKIVLEDPAIDVCIIWLQLMHGYGKVLRDLFREIKRSVTKPFLVCWIEAPEDVRRDLVADDICIVSATERAVDAAEGMVRWGEITRRPPPLAETQSSRPASGEPTAETEVVASLEAAGLLEASGLTLVGTRLARDAAEAGRIAAELGFPVAVKIESVDIPHKTEAGGVVLGLASREAVEKAAADVLASAARHAPAARIAGVLVQRMSAPATEIVLGLRRDPVFGHVVMVGLGGIFVEVLKDVAFARAPISHDEALGLLDSLKGKPLLMGARGREPVDLEALARAITALSRLALAHPEIEELDLNPVFAGADGTTAVDWLMLRRTSRA